MQAERRKPEARVITETGKDSHRAILSVCHEGEPWSPKSKLEAVDEILSGEVEYFVSDRREANPQRLIPVRVVRGVGGPYLRSVADGTSVDNLASLPDGPIC